MLSFTPAVIGAIHQQFLCPLSGHSASDASSEGLRFPARALSLCYTDWFILSCFQTVLLSHPLKEVLLCPRTFTGYLCVPDDLGSIFICAVQKCHDPGSCHFSLPILGPATVIWWGRVQCHGQESSKVHTYMQHADVILAPRWFNCKLSYTSTGFFPTGFSSCISKGWPSVPFQCMSQTRQFLCLSPSDTCWDLVDKRAHSRKKRGL